ncbi:MAG: cell division protein SepF [Microthrixaceae bacterium]
MSNFMRNARAWLGLGNDPYYDDDLDEGDDPGYDDDRTRSRSRDRYDEFEPADDHRVDPRDDHRDALADESLVTRPTGPAAGGSVTSISSARDWDDDGGVRVIPAGGEGEARGVVRPLPSASRPEVVTPTSFNDVQQVADHFKRGRPVLMSLQQVDRDLSRRIIDFASGLCYGLEGNMERAADQVFLLTPVGVSVSDDEKRRIREGGLLDGD